MAKSDRPTPQMKTYRVWADGDTAVVEKTDMRHAFELIAEWYCDEHMQPGCDYEFGEALTICVECEGVTRKFNVTPEQEITYDIEEVE